MRNWIRFNSHSHYHLFGAISCPFLSYREMIQFYESEQSELSLIYGELYNFSTLKPNKPKHF